VKILEALIMILPSKPQIIQYLIEIVALIGSISALLTAFEGLLSPTNTAEIIIILGILTRVTPFLNELIVFLQNSNLQFAKKQ
jgi:hypothetical protein